MRKIVWHSATKDDLLDIVSYYQEHAIYTLHSRFNRILYTVREKDVLILIIWNNRRDISRITEMLKDRDN